MKRRTRKFNEARRVANIEARDKEREATKRQIEARRALAAKPRAKAPSAAPRKTTRAKGPSKSSNAGQTAQ